MNTLLIQSGNEKGNHYVLDTERALHIGRAMGCEIVLSDPNSSRFHAVIYYEDNNWHVRDTDSRNGTFIDGERIKHARLTDQSMIVIGKTTMQLFLLDEESSAGDSLSQTVYEDLDSWSRREVDVVREPTQLLEDANQLLDLYQLSLSLLGGQRPDEIIDTTLELLLERTSSQSVMLVTQPTEEKLKIRRQFPREGPPVPLDRAKLLLVLKQREMLVGSDGDSYLMVPIIHQERSIGVLVLQRGGGSYPESLIELTLGAAGLLAMGITQSTMTENLRLEHKRIAERNADSEEMIGDSKPMLRLKERIERVGRASGSVLIRGESGSGKELVARAVHRCSTRIDRPLLSVNCAAIPHDLLESQLFGHKRGAFTGAEKDHDGLFQQADQGTLFLDEIGELSLAGQAKLLRILEGYPFLPVGATKQVSVDVRVIAATNRDLNEFVRDGRFREDLFYRLSVFELVVPPLRDRGDDLDTLIDYFVDHFQRQHGRPHLTLDAAARAHLKDYTWPGNVRQLRNVIDSAVVMADEPHITESDLGLRDVGSSHIDTLRIDVWERRLITKALQRVDGNVPKASELLGISRATTYRKITEYEIER